jgi:hypothetical protein
MAQELYVSTDIEADGPIPGPHSMLSIGSVAYDATGRELGSFSANLQTLPGASADPATMAWWKGFPEAWAACRADPEDPASAMARYAAWLVALPGKPVFVGHPAAWDFSFVHWYLVRFTGKNPFGHAALDLKTLMLVLLGGRFRDATKRHLPRRFFAPDHAHSHVALDDAREQGHMAMRLLEEVVWRRAAATAPGDTTAAADAPDTERP